MEVRIIRQLLQYKVGDISARDFEFCGGVGIWKAVSVFAGAISVCEGSWTDNGPVETALHDVIFLHDMVCVRFTQKEPIHDVLPEEI